MELCLFPDGAAVNGTIVWKGSAASAKTEDSCAMEQGGEYRNTMHWTIVMSRRVVSFMKNDTTDLPNNIRYPSFCSSPCVWRKPRRWR